MPDPSIAARLEEIRRQRLEQQEKAASSYLRVSFSFRTHIALAERIVAEAESRNMTPGALVRLIVERAMASGEMLALLLEGE